MTKKLLKIILVLMMTVSLFACSKNSEQNKIVGKWSYGDMSISGTIANVGFLSQAVDIANIKNNIAQSFSLGWFIPADALASYGIVCDN